MGIKRRDFVKSGVIAAGTVVMTPALLREAFAAPAQPDPAPPYGALGAPDANGLMLPPGFTSRRIATSMQPVPGTSYVLPRFPDGQATYKADDGGWFLVTNSESFAAEGGGVSAMRFAPDGTVTAAYRIVGETNRNCAGGPTPWGTWLTGEEVGGGLIWECDPAGRIAAKARPMLGAFEHEAAAVDPVYQRVYLSQDHPDGGFYRCTPTTYPDLSAGVLEVAQVIDTTVTWHVAADPTTTLTGNPTRLQVPLMTKFPGGEGLWYSQGIVYFTTKTDKRVWIYNTATTTMDRLYDFTAAPGSSLDQVDNITVGANGDVFVCEDGGNIEIGLITPTRLVSPFLRFVSAEHVGSEVCGVVFNPTQTRMYLTSQRAAIALGVPMGAIYEISGPFTIPPRGIPADQVYGPPLGGSTPPPPPPPGPPPPPAPPPPPSATPPRDRMRPVLRIPLPTAIRRSILLARGLEIQVRVNEASTVAATLDSLALRVGKAGRPSNVVLARVTVRHKGNGTLVKLRLRLGRTARRELARRRGSVRARVLITARDAAGNQISSTRRITIGRVS